MAGTKGLGRRGSKKVAKKKATKKKTKPATKAAKMYRRTGMGRGGRPSAMIKKFDLPSMSTDQLDKLIRAAIAEIQGRLEEYEDTLD